MGIGRVIWSGIVGMVILVPMAWISFTFLNLTGSVTGGLIEGLEDLLASIPGVLGMILSILGGMILGVLLIFLFPVHWALYYRPDDVMLIIALMTPWILTCTIASAISAHSPRGGLHTSLAIGIGYAIPTTILYFALGPIIGALTGGGGIGMTVTSLIDGLSLGLTDLPFLAAALLGIFEGCLVGAFFGAFIGSLKYKPEEQIAKTSGISYSTSSKESTSEPTLSSSEDFCENCGAKLAPKDEFCTNCGAKS
ncbi:MAG: zinc-ribbon domain-containing protein [Candidatus Lokiarchaeota archaeon]|nr:zinc-ribbon domain-containing protein [Candidatus Lokiarchaeota archaeon]MBD3201252.1 zinc-ribbon domain-containing protein [Candidatus Lokiarchaeota archaeon]